MKNYYKIVAAVAVLFILAIVLFAVITGSGKAFKFGASNEDILELNDIVKTAEENSDYKAIYAGREYTNDFVILNMNNIVVYDSRPEGGRSQVTVEGAIKDGYPYSYILRNNSIAGCVVLLNDNMASYRHMRLIVIIAMAVSVVIMISAALIYGRYIKRNIVTPFARMEKFAGKIAEGNLDEPLLMERNNMFGVFSESFDVMREELRESKKREISLQKKERELVASLSHDLKTPVTGIKLTTELLKAKLEMDGDDSGMSDKLDNIYRKADQIDVLVTDLFTSTLEDLGEFKVNCRDEQSSILGDIVRDHDDKGLVESGEIPGVIINVDSKRISQVIGNILHNSYKYANTSIKVEYKVIDDYLEMSIRDFGPGVPEDEIELITNKFYRGKAQVSSKADGSGLGLYIARILMDKMNGEMIPSNTGDGLCITLLIPLG